MRVALLGIVVAAAGLAAEAEWRLDVRAPAGRWLELREAVARGNAPPLARGLVAAAFNDPKTAEKHLWRAIRAAPRSDEAYAAHSMLAELCFRVGRYRQAIRHEQEMRALRPAGPYLAHMGQPRDQAVAARGYSRFPNAMTDKGRLVVPVTVNGVATGFDLDTGAGISVVNEAEAERLGLDVEPAAASAVNIAGGDVAMRFALAREVVVGKFRLRNVAFGVMRDDDWPFPTRGSLGMPVLLVFETMRWQPGGALEIGFASERQAGEPNICLNPADPAVEARFMATRLSLKVDTGSEASRLYAPFAKKFGALLEKAGRKGTFEFTAPGQVAKLESVALPEVRLRVGGFDAVLRPAHVLPGEGEGDDGVIGMDVLKQARTVTLDFKAMRLVLE